MSEKEKMLAGRLYDPADPELLARRTLAHRLCREYNGTDDTEEETRRKLLDLLLPGHGADIYFQGPIQFDYGSNTVVGERTYANFNFVCLDCCPVRIGKDVFFGPNVSILTPMHPLRWQERNLYRNAAGALTDREYAKPVHIGDNCWIAGDVTICGGVTIDRGCVIGAGSVVTRDIPDDTLAAGVPCRPIRRITGEDRLREP